MKIISFNINSLRARPHQLQAVVEQYNPDIIALQETKVDDPQFPLEMIEPLGYTAVYHGQKGHYGVATLCKDAPVSIQKGFPNDDENAQRRALITEHEINGKTFFVFNGYFPQGESRSHPEKFPAKQKFYQDLSQFLDGQTENSEWLVVGDMNISFQDNDIGIGPQNAKRWLQTGKCSFLPEERDWLQTIVDKGFYDTYRKHYPDVDNVFSWFDYRSKGFEDEPKRGLRIDLILATEKLHKACINAGIDYAIRGMEKPSDHAPIWAEFNLDID